MKIIYSPEFSGNVYVRPAEGSNVMMDTVVLNTVGLINLLELRLGLHYEELPHGERLAHYYDAVCCYMSACPDNIMAASFKTSGLATAKAMLSWREQLRGINWDFDGSHISERLAVLIEVEDYFRKKSGCDMAGRLHIVHDQVVSQKLDCSDMEFVLAVPGNLLLPAVQSLLWTLEENGAAFADADTAEQCESNLSRVRTMISCKQKGKITLDPADESILIYKFPDEKAACEYLAFHDMEDVDVWINGENKQMDNWLRLMGKPVTGSVSSGCSPQLTQMFVMGLGMFSTPLNVNTLIEWLNMPLHPMDRFFRSALADLIVKEGGYRNEKCIKVIQDYIDGKYVYLDQQQRALPQEEQDQLRRQDIKKRKSLLEVFLPPVQQVTDIKVEAVRRFISELSSWSRKRAHHMKDDKGNSQWVEQLCSVADMCDAFHILLGTVSGDTIEYRTIDSWMSTIYQKNEYTNAVAEIGCRTVVDSPGKLATAADKTVWVGVDGDASKAQDCAFLYPTEREKLQEEHLISPRTEEAENAYYETLMLTPLSMTSKQLILVVRERIGCEPALKHPLIVRLEQQVQNLEQIIRYPKPGASDKHECEIVDNGGIAAEQEFSFADQLKWPDHLSPTKVSTLVEHPLDYLMEDLLGIVPDGKAQMADVRTTKGNVAHAVIDRLFSPRGEQKYALTEDIKSRIDTEYDKVYNEVLEAKGAILLLAENKLAERLLHEQLRNCLDVLLEILSDNRLKVTGCEQMVEADMNLGLPRKITEDCTSKSKDIRGYIDMTLEDDNGHPIVFDFKWSSWKGYQTILEENRSVQLELYRWMLTKEKTSQVEKVAYFLMPQAHLYSKEKFEGRNCIQIDSSNTDDIVQQLRKSIIYRKRQIESGIVETNGLFNDLQYVIDTQAKGLFPLKEDEQNGIKQENRFSKYSLFNM